MTCLSTQTKVEAGAWIINSFSEQIFFRCVLYFLQILLSTLLNFPLSFFQDTRCFLICLHITRNLDMHLVRQEWENKRFPPVNSRVVKSAKYLFSIKLSSTLSSSLPRVLSKLSLEVFKGGKISCLVWPTRFHRVWKLSKKVSTWNIFQS